ncbi:MAG: hypothetical protein HUJ53_08050, partial [Holdemanella sp.]|nr:hypothetical protein [Holdemanella sp.]
IKALDEKQKNKEKLDKEKYQQLELEKARRKSEMEELLKNAKIYSVEEIKEIAELSTSQNKRAVIKMDDDGNIYKVYESVSLACSDMKLNSKTIRSAATGKGKHAGGFCWKYADDYLKSIDEMEQ